MSKKSQKKQEKRKARRQDKRNKMLISCFATPAKEEQPRIEEKEPQQNNATVKEHQGSQKDIEKILESLDLPTIENPGKESGIVYYAQALNKQGECPYIVIRAFKNGKNDTYKKAMIRGYASFRPNLYREGWEVAIKKKPNSGVYTKIKEFLPTHEEALKVLLSELRSTS